MQWPSTRSDCLRALGHVLDELGTERVLLEEGDTHLTVRCTKGGTEAEYHYSASQVEELLRQARALRGTGTHARPNGYEQRLRAIGHELDRRRARGIRLRQTNGSFELLYLVYGEGRVRLSYTPTMLHELIEQGPRRRSAAQLGP